ncbi:hypothetical protein N0V88_005533 [Collariella sp. IMI 366227]|nr:hypothetical protein N0V88_005533 [Collariella sp. IMI 366227]
MSSPQAPPVDTSVTFQSLPGDILGLILDHCPDLDTFLSCIATCRAFYDVFQSAPKSFARNLVHRLIEPSLLPEAILVFCARSYRTRHMSDLPLAVSQILSWRNDEQRPNFLNLWSLRQAISALRLNAIISTLAGELATSHLSKFEELSDHKQKLPSEQELRRINRALYRYEIYSALLPRHAHDSDEQSQGYGAAQLAFLGRASAWENEQLVCVYEALWRRVAPAYNDLALHDITWGCSCATYAVELGHPGVEGLLERGLRSVFDIAHAETYARRYELIGTGALMPDSKNKFLLSAFRKYRYSVLSTPPGSAWTETVFPLDSDQGPERFWIWSHKHWLGHPEEERRMRVVAQDGHENMRNSGCVFWDEERLDDSGILGRDWVDLGASDDAIRSAAPSREDQIETWRERMELYMKGKRGYWPLRRERGRNDRMKCGGDQRLSA